MTLFLVVPGMIGSQILHNKEKKLGAFKRTSLHTPQHLAPANAFAYMPLLHIAGYEDRYKSVMENNIRCKDPTERNLQGIEGADTRYIHHRCIHEFEFA